MSRVHGVCRLGKALKQQSHIDQKLKSPSPSTPSGVTSATTPSAEATAKPAGGGAGRAGRTSGGGEAAPAAAFAKFSGSFVELGASTTPVGHSAPPTPVEAAGRASGGWAVLGKDHQRAALSRILDRPQPLRVLRAGEHLRAVG